MTSGVADHPESSNLLHRQPGWLTFLSPQLVSHLSPYNLASGFLGEGLVMLWLLPMGVNVQRWKEQATAATNLDLAARCSPSVDHREVCNREQYLDSLYALMEKQTSPGAAIYGDQSAIRVESAKANLLWLPNVSAYFAPHDPHGPD